MKKIKLFIAGLITLSGLALAIAPLSVSADGISTIGDTCNNAAGQGTGSNEVCGSTKDNLPSMIKTIVNVLLYIVGAASVVMIIWGGIVFTTSGGNENSIKSARAIITYSVVGLVIAFLAYAIVNWVIKNI